VRRFYRIRELQEVAFTTVDGQAFAIAEDWNLVQWLLKTSPKEPTMATVNFSVPDEVKKEFQEIFAHENKSAVITRLMKQAIEERKRQHTRAAAIEGLLELRKRQRPVSDEEVWRARQMGRP
jgi:predicted transcriptional regulator